MFKNLRELIVSMPDEKSCREYLANQRWADGKIVCPYCSHPKSYVLLSRTFKLGLEAESALNGQAARFV